MITIDVLTVPEQQQLAEQETRIEQGIRVFFGEVGEALAIIRSQRLYRASYKNFEEYCRSRWGFGDNYAHKLISAAETIDNLKSANVATLPTTESQARELATLNPEEQVEAWMNAVQNSPDGKPTAEQVKSAVEDVKAEIDRATRKTTDIPFGSKARVIAGEHKGLEVEVESVEKGAVAHCRLPGGDMYPFLAGEIEVTEFAVATPAPAKPKSDVKAENQALKDLLREILAEVEDTLAPELKARAEAVLG